MSGQLLRSFLATAARDGITHLKIQGLDNAATMTTTRSNRELLPELRQQLGMTETDVAQFLAKKTKRPCSLRTVQSWTNNPDTKHARNCPNWAIELLQEELHRRG